MADLVLKTARKAFDLFAEGWATGNFEPYIALLADEMTFWFPTGAHRGKFEGATGRQKMIAKCQDHVAAGDRLTLHPPQHILTDGDSVMFEFEADGLYADEPYKGHNAIAFEVKADKIVGFREYFGDLGA
ncbi:nuclear transport factor 2 family protein [Romeria aff. gracilis LEGE 07310]|uniref:Nuclear transport factor 2 family protein n=1 Tax=Vasconcelosia minhoensis LEGE 07310 TaxID=915328 RepID=A0A8J7DCX8_9CYAN|nr:nuclear transport factor 2 family protein [Romeria gracilis]MBE9079342.1 nuclear transport factor 2 family protein [Romeria aff. gracilis LEGE 07310]